MDINIPLCKNYYDFYLWYQLSVKKWYRFSANCGTDSRIILVLIE